MKNTITHFSFLSFSIIFVLLCINPKQAHAQPSNDDFCDAIGLPVNALNSTSSCTSSGPFDHTLTGSTIEAGEPNISTLSAWFSFTAPASGVVDIRLNSDESNDPYMHLYSLAAGSTCPTIDFDYLVYVIENDDSNDGFPDPAILNQPVVPGVEYYVQIQDLNSGGFDFCIEITEQCPVVNASLPTYTWIGTEDDDWNNACNWDSGVVPDLYNQDVVINSSSNNPKVEGFLLDIGDIDFTIKNDAVLTIDGQNVSDGITLINPNHVFQIEPSAQLIMYDLTTSSITCYEGEIVNDGLISTSKGIWAEGSNNVNITNNGRITFNTANQAINLNNSLSTFVNSDCGHIQANTGSSFTLYTGSFTNNGMINYEHSGGTFNISIDNTMGYIYDPNASMTYSGGETFDFPVSAYSFTGDLDEDGVSFCAGDVDDFCFVFSQLENTIGSLRYAVECANAGDTIFFSPDYDYYSLYLDEGQIVIDKNLTFMGNGEERTIIDGNDQPMSRIFVVNSGVTVKMENLTIQNAGSSSFNGAGAAIYNSGNLELLNCTFKNNTSNYAASAIVNYSNLNIANCVFDGNVNTDLSANYSTIWTQGSSSSTRITQTLFHDNTAYDVITHWNGDCEIEQNTFGHNTLTQSEIILISTVNQVAVRQNIFNDDVPDPVLVANSSLLAIANLSYNADTDLLSVDDNIVGDALFNNPSGGDFSLQSSSPAIQAGFNDIIPLDLLDADDDFNFSEQLELDLLGTDRTTFTTVDIGAIEYTSELCDVIQNLECGDVHLGSNVGELHVLPSYFVGSGYINFPYANMYRFTPSYTGTVEISLTDMVVDVEDLDLYVFNGLDSCDPAPIDNSQIVGVNDELVTFAGNAGEEYFIVVLGYEQSQGTYSLSIDCTENCHEDIVRTNPEHNYPAGIQNFETNLSITAENIISGNANIIYDGAGDVSLNVGFEVQAGAEFLGMVDGCANPNATEDNQENSSMKKNSLNRSRQINTN